MPDRTFTGCEADSELEYIEGEDELDCYLEAIVPYIGWVVVYFNSLEDHISDFIREAILRDPLQDERLDVFLSEMMFAGKCRALMHLYGQIIESGAVKYTQEDLCRLEKVLLECARRRNEYAHGDWIGVRREGYVCVKSQSKRQGVIHRYKKFEVTRLEEDVAFISNARHLLTEFNDNLQDQLWGRES